MCRFWPGVKICNSFLVIDIVHLCVLRPWLVRHLLYQAFMIAQGGASADSNNTIVKGR